MFVDRDLPTLTYIDCYNRTAEANVLTNKTTVETLRALKEIANRWEIPKQLIMDNGREFALYKFESWCLENKFSTHKASPS